MGLLLYTGTLATNLPTVFHTLKNKQISPTTKGAHPYASLKTSHHLTSPPLPSLRPLHRRTATTIAMASPKSQQSTYPFPFPFLSLSTPTNNSLVDLASLSATQLNQVKKQLDDELEHLTSSFSQLRAAQAKFRECLRSIATGVSAKVEGTSISLIDLGIGKRVGK